MRDVTDNVTGELDVEVKRGRGRPRKEGALTNAQRQAAFRARRKAGGIAVTPKELLLRLQRPVVHQVDAYDECRLEVEALRAELAEAHETIDELNDELIPLRAVKQRLEEEVAEGNLQFIELCNQRDDALDMVRELREREAAKTVTPKTVTKSVAKSVTAKRVTKKRA